MKQRTLIRVDIMIDQDWAIGAAPDLWFRPDSTTVDEEERAVRLPVQRDPGERYQLPATSLVGSLRRHLGEAGDVWLGYAAGRSTVPSQVRCLAASLHPASPDQPLDSRIVTTTRIDADRRAAASGALRREEVLPQAKVTWWLQWEHGNPTLDLGGLIRSLSTWRPIIGRRRSANRGRAHVTDVWHRTVDLATEAGLTWWLADRHAMPWGSIDPLPQQEWTHVSGTTADAGAEALRAAFRVVDALHLGGHGETDNLSHTGDRLPSASWRGVFRHRVEHILRVSSPTTEESRKAAAETVERLFGSERAAGASRGKGRRGQLRFDDSAIHGRKQQRTHVAIDRISGGTVAGYAEDPKDDKGGLLFAVEYYGPGATGELIIYNDSDEPLRDTDEALLRAVIKDLQDGIIGVGGLTSRGYGTVAFDQAGASA